MSNYAHILHGKVENIVVADPGFISTQTDIYINIDNLAIKPNIGDAYLNGDFSAQQDPEAYITVVIPTQPVQVGTDITVTASVHDASGSLLSVENTYYVPVMRTSDGLQAAFLTMEFTNGQASVVFKIDNPGVYSVAMDKIHPKPTAILQQEVLIVVV